MRKTVILVFLAAVLAVPSAQAGDFLKWITGRSGIEGSGDLVTDTRNLGDFSRIESTGSFDIFVTVGEGQEMTITFDDNLIDLIKTRVRGKTLKIYSRDSYSSRYSCKIDLKVPYLESIRLSGSGDVEIFDLSGELFECSISGSGDIRADGEVEEVDIRVSGSGDVDTRELIAHEASVRVSGSGDVKVFASEFFDGSVSGSGDIDIYGNPERMSRHVSGSGDIRKRR
ncbi:MAG: DUF2807 domain-containing protein [Candidatus Zixiibacteriota bacterium]|nr:MAG: DUF2807 domain-containing protein [candidate division Zixibacteria bacterium]